MFLIFYRSDVHNISGSYGWCYADFYYIDDNSRVHQLFQSQVSNIYDTIIVNYLRVLDHKQKPKVIPGASCNRGK